MYRSSPSCRSSKISVMASPLSCATWAMGTQGALLGPNPRNVRPKHDDECWMNSSCKTTPFADMPKRIARQPWKRMCASYCEPKDVFVAMSAGCLFPARNWPTNEGQMNQIRISTWNENKHTGKIPNEREDGWWLGSYNIYIYICTLLLRNPIQQPMFLIEVSNPPSIASQSYIAWPGQATITKCPLSIHEIHLSIFIWRRYGTPVDFVQPNHQWLMISRASPMAPYVFMKHTKVDTWLLVNARYPSCSHPQPNSSGSWDVHPGSWMVNCLTQLAAYRTSISPTQLLYSNPQRYEPFTSSC